ncbi:MAG: peroxiredoxin [Clostridiales bacterium]|jgi:peroxiredoxin (alkyl hydroperoxide reductase subunit C)|nr:peroxiredoxin [Clostridiales bacterium]
MIIGKRIDSFETEAFQKGRGFFPVSFDRDFIGKWSVVCFYPADFTFVCPTELEDLQNQYATLKKMGVEVYSVSTDTHFVHAAWSMHSPAISKVEYIMLGDPSHKISRIFDVLNEDSGLAFRGTFVIDPDGVVQTAEINQLGIGRDANVLVEKVRAAQHIKKNPNEVCPAKWKQGDKPMKPGLDLVGKI